VKFLLNLLISAISVFIAAYIIPGVAVEGFKAALIFAVVLGAVNVFIKPVLILLTLPITVLTLGLFTFVINISIVVFVARIVPGFEIDSLLSAVLFSFVLSLVNSFLGLFFK